MSDVCKNTKMHLAFRMKALQDSMHGDHNLEKWQAVEGFKEEIAAQLGQDTHDDVVKIAFEMRQS